MESDHRLIENRIDQYRSLLADAVDRLSYLTIARHLDAEIERLTPVKESKIENGHDPLRSASLQPHR
jgi:hypothetical protein